MGLYKLTSRLLTRLGQRTRRDLKLFDYTRRLLGNDYLKEAIILDAGCGDMPITSRLARTYATATIVGLDLRKPTKKMSTADFIVADAEHMPFRDKSFDAYVSFSLLEHLENPIKHVRETSRVLKQSSFAILQVPNETYFLEPHSLVPFYYTMPKFLRNGLMNLMGYNYLRINELVIPEYVSQIFMMAGFNEIGKVGIYHFPILRYLGIAPSYLFVFKKF